MENLGRYLRDGGARRPMADGWTIAEAVHHLHPAIKPRELARILADAPPCGVRHGRLGRKAKVYPIDAILRAHADWARRQYFRT